MITVLSANAGIDRTYEVDNFAVGRYHFPRRFHVTAGGKGLNVARVLRKLGREVMVTGFAGGHIGNALTAMLKADGLRTDFVRIAEESRVCLNIVDPVTRSQTQVDEIGPLVSPGEIDQLRRQWSRLLPASKLVVIAGSAPRGVPNNIYTEFVFMAKERRLPVILDVREPYLAEAVQAGPTIVKPNLSELSTLAGGAELSVPVGVVEAAREVLRQGVKMVLASLGRQGAIAVTAEAGNWWAKPPAVEALSEVGSGDAMVAGLVHASLGRESLQGRLRWAVAAGAANAAKIGAATCDLADIEPLLAQVTIEPLDENGNPLGVV